MTHFYNFYESDVNLKKKMALRAFVNKILIIIIRKEKKNRIRKKSTVNRNIKNTVSNLISICPLERNISVLENTDVPYIYICVCVCMFIYIYIYIKPIF